MCVGRTAESLKGADEDYFRDMDYGITKNPEELAKTLAPFVPGITPEDAVKRVATGRNNWIVWTAGNDRLWNTISYRSVGTLDFLKSLSNHPSLKFSRSNRWNYLGLVNEPCFEKPSGPRKDRYGLWLDVRSQDCPPDPFENQTKYPGVKYGARGKNIPAGSYPKSRRTSGTCAIAPMRSIATFATGRVTRLDGAAEFDSFDFTQQA